MDLFSSQVLSNVVANLKRPKKGLLAAFYRQVIQSATEEISFDIDDRKRFLAPLVSAVSPGKLRKKQARKVATLRPAYVKLKDPFRPGDALKRAAGESFGTPLSPETRLMVQIGQALQNHVDDLTRRLEWMAIQSLVLGKYTLVGDDYPSTVVDFGRDPSLTSALAGGALWSAPATSNPVKNLNTFSSKAVKFAGSPTKDIVMDIDAFQLFRDHPMVVDKLKTIQVITGTLETIEPAQEGLVYRGDYEGYRMWTYDTWFVDDADGVEKVALPSGTVLGVGDISGVQHYGAIHDHAAGMQALPLFSKSWVEEDPSVRMIMTQSAPLVVPQRVNASFCLTVL